MTSNIDYLNNCYLLSMIIKIGIVQKMKMIGGKKAMVYSLKLQEKGCGTNFLYII